MAPRLLTRICSTLRRPRRISVGNYLAARQIGDLAVEDAFFWQVQLASGVFKATNRRRFDDTFALLHRGIPHTLGHLRVLDVACSSGISTVELHQALVRPGLTVETVGTDITTMVLHVIVDGCGLIYDLADNILGAEIDGMIVNRSPDRSVQLYHPMRVRRARRLIAAHERVGRFRPAGNFNVTEVPLVSSAVERATGVKVIEEDLLHPKSNDKFDLIRAANILNRGYFSDQQLRAGVSAMLGRLYPGALLFVVRTAGSTNHGTLWRWTAAGLTLIERIGEGCEIGELVEDVARKFSAR